jgi:hypothetical protein
MASFSRRPHVQCSHIKAQLPPNVGDMAPSTATGYPITDHSIIWPCCFFTVLGMSKFVKFPDMGDKACKSVPPRSVAAKFHKETITSKRTLRSLILWRTACPQPQLGRLGPWAVTKARTPKRKSRASLHPLSITRKCHFHIYQFVTMLDLNKCSNKQLLASKPQNGTSLSPVFNPRLLW